MGWWSDAEYLRFRDEIRGDMDDDDLGVYEVWWTANPRFPDRALDRP